MSSSPISSLRLQPDSQAQNKVALSDNSTSQMQHYDYDAVNDSNNNDSNDSNNNNEISLVIDIPDDVNVVVGNASANGASPPPSHPSNSSSPSNSMCM